MAQRRDRMAAEAVGSRADLPPCPACGTAAAEDGGPIPLLTSHLRAAGPWLAERWAGHSPNFHLEEAVCPRCAALLDVTERRTAHQPGSPADADHTEEQP